MQKLGNTYITNAGKELLASVDAGNDRMIYTNAVLASNDFSTMSDDAIRQITALDTLQSAPIMVASRVKTTINLAATFTNAQVKTDFDFWSIGWFAKGDATLTDEILLAISPSETQQTMPASLNGASTASITPKYAMGLSEASEVVIQPDPAGQVSKDWVIQQINVLKQQGVINNDVTLTKNDDCNDKTITSIARINGDLPKNAPASVSKSGQLITYGYGSDDKTTPVVQLYYDDGNSTNYIRYYNMAKKTWSDWDSALTKSQFANNLPDNIADDTKVVHLTSDEEIAGKKTFDTAPINKTNGKPFITADDAPQVDTSKLVTTDGTADGNVTNPIVNFKDKQATIEKNPVMSLIDTTGKTADEAKTISTANPNALTVGDTAMVNGKPLVDSSGNDTGWKDCEANQDIQSNGYLRQRVKDGVLYVLGNVSVNANSKNVNLQAVKIEDGWDIPPVIDEPYYDNMGSMIQSTTNGMGEYGWVCLCNKASVDNKYLLSFVNPSVNIVDVAVNLAIPIIAPNN